MSKFLFKRLLLAFYCTAKRLINKNMSERIVPSTVWMFLTPFSFIVAGLLSILISVIPFKIKYPEFIIMGFVFIIGYVFFNFIKSLIFKWNIEKEYKRLSRINLRKKYILAVLFFWGSFGLFFYLAVKFMGGYSI